MKVERSSIPLNEAASFGMVRFHQMFNFVMCGITGTFTYVVEGAGDEEDDRRSD